MKAENLLCFLQSYCDSFKLINSAAVNMYASYCYCFVGNFSELMYYIETVRALLDEVRIYLDRI